MGCICSKGGSSDEYGGSQRGKVSCKPSRRFSAPLNREEIAVEADGSSRNDGTARLISKSQENLGSTPLSSDEGEKNPVPVDRPRKSKQQSQKTPDIIANGSEPKLRITTVPNGVQAEQVAAGWPSWLTAVAGEAIKGWVPRRADSFEKLDKIGQGTYSHVYKARDLETNKIVALKKVRFVNMDPESVRFMAREIHVLRRLDHPNVMKLEGLIAPRMSNSLYLVFEYMEHDLAGLAATPGLKFTEPQIKCYMQQLLRGLEHCHGRGVLHRDIKGSNLLINNDGILQIADFGLATFFRPDQKQQLTSRVVTLWYRPPELLLGATDYGVAVDLWSAGCILAELFAGKPIMPGRTEVEQLHKIFKLCGSPSEEYWRTSKLPHATIFKPQHPYRRCVAEIFKDFPSYALALMDVLLAIEPEHRGTAASALKSKVIEFRGCSEEFELELYDICEMVKNMLNEQLFFTTAPHACDPSSLPKYPPSKEFDAKLREEEARRKKAASIKEHGSELIRKERKESKAIPAPDANAELQSSLQKRLAQVNAKSSSEHYNPQEDCGSGFPMHPPKIAGQNGLSYSGTLLQSGTAESLWKKRVKDDELQKAPVFSSLANGTDPKTYVPEGAANLPNFSGPIAARNSNHKDRNTNQPWPEQRSNRRYNLVDDAEGSGKQEWTHHLLDRPSFLHKKSERPRCKEPTAKCVYQGHRGKKNKIHYSGPLLPASEDLDEMLKEHERQIQEAVRKARVDKTNPKKSYHAAKAQSEALLHSGSNGSGDI
ncbi:hypothetical protein ACLOJK_016951 [Asimina triloba]